MIPRRSFLRTSAASATLLSLFRPDLSALERDTSGPIEKRSLGRTGEKLSILGFGGLVLHNAPIEDAGKLVRRAFDAGVNYFDVAPGYRTAEERMGPALEPFRSRVFLSCKTQKRSAAEAQEELERSLARLRTDHFDLYQLHAVTTDKDVESIFAPGGAIETLVAAKKAGKVRFLGFSAHSVEAAMALMDRFDFDTIMFPVNQACWHAGNFGPQVLARALEKKMGILALKAMARRPWPKGTKRTHTCWYEPLTDPAEALQGLRFTLSHPVTAALQPADVRCLDLALELAPKVTPLKATEVDTIKKLALQETPLFRFPRAVG